MGVDRRALLVGMGLVFTAACAKARQPRGSSVTNGDWARFKAAQDAFFDAKPLVLLVGQYSVGKTSFVRAMLGNRDFPGQRIGPVLHICFSSLPSTYQR